MYGWQNAQYNGFLDSDVPLIEEQTLIFVTRETETDFFSEVTLHLTPTEDNIGVHSIELSVLDLENKSTIP